MEFIAPVTINKISRILSLLLNSSFKKSRNNRYTESKESRISITILVLIIYGFYLKPVLTYADLYDLMGLISNILIKIN